jgi:uncharacterized protein YggU (UPF0235/DUF167 family)
MKTTVIVKTGSKKGPLVEPISETSLRVYLREKPHDGEANAALMKLLSDHLNVPKTSIKIVAGQKSHVKIIEY